MISLERQIGQRTVMIRGFDDDLMGTDAVHDIVHAVAAIIEITLHPQGRVFVGDHPHPPVGGIGQAAGANGKDFRRGLVFVAVSRRGRRSC